MGKKRKASAKAAAEDDRDIEAPIESSRKRIRTFEDVADSEDEFHLNNDQVLLGESAESKRRRREQEREAFLQPSDEEVLEDDLDASDYDSEEAGARVAEDEEEDEAWGTTRADLYGADAIETEEQALEEEAEARRLQKKHLQAMNAADYGFDETEWAAAPEITAEKSKTVKETLKDTAISEGLSHAERLKLLQTRYPEFDPLRRELMVLSEVLAIIKEERSESDQLRPHLEAKYQALSAYLGALAMYFALLTSGSGSPSLMPAAQLRDHEIMTTLVQCRNLWQDVEELPEDEDVAEQPADVSISAEVKPLPVQASRKRTKKQLQAEAEEKAKAARLAERLTRLEASLAKLGSQLNVTKPKTLRPRVLQDEDLGEEVQLTAAQAEEKAKKRKSLRFYTSQIAQKANKRSAAGRVAGGDDDVPHRERLRDRQIRLNAEAEKRGKKQSDAGADLGGDSDEEDAAQARQIRDDVDEDDYYDMVAAKKSKKKADKAAQAQAQRLAAEQGARVVEEETVGVDGKRKITYAIEKNKGLTPNRRKDIRNPRVKKRKKFEQKTKQLASMKPTYKGGEGRGGYGGELTGIKSNLVRSVKL